MSRNMARYVCHSLLPAIVAVSIVVVGSSVAVAQEGDGADKTTKNETDATAPKGVLGRTVTELSEIYGVAPKEVGAIHPDDARWKKSARMRKYLAEIKRRGPIIWTHRLQPPAVKLLRYAPTNAPYSAVVGHDKDDRSCFVRITRDPSKGLEGKEAFRKQALKIMTAQGYSWAHAKSLTAVFPILRAKEDWTESWISWRHVAGGLYAGTPMTRMTKYDVLRDRAIFRSDDRQTYAVVDFWRDQKFAPQGELQKITIASAHTFWKWVVDEFVRQLEEGMPGRRTDEDWEDLTYEQFLGTLIRGEKKERAIIVKRLGAVLEEVLDNPAVSVDVVRSAVNALVEHDDKDVVKDLLRAAGGKDTSLAERADAILVAMEGEKATEQLISSLRDKRSAPLAAKALKEITGQDFGQDYRKWMAWWEKQEDGPSETD